MKSGKKTSGCPVKREKKSLCDKSKPNIYYHYTSLYKMWLILEKETLRATQACFSNDSEEISKGIKALNNILNANPEKNPFPDSLDFDKFDNYIVCFCQQNDKLSQWRAYCKDGGVSFGFELGYDNIKYYYPDSKKYSNVAHNINLSPVFYLDNTTVPSGIPGTITEIDLQKKVIGGLKDFHDVKAKQDAISLLVPYIKQFGFVEEEEHRLLIENNFDPSLYDIDFKLDEIIKYSEDDCNKKPYINIKFGRTYDEKEFVNQIIIRGPQNECERIKKKIQDLLSKKAHLIGIKTGSPFSIQCIDDKILQIIVGEAYEENQRKLFRFLDFNLNTVDKENIYFWCDGHLPIRSITVSPSENQDQILRMIKHYCTHSKFWLKYVNVSVSNIPFRNY